MRQFISFVTRTVAVAAIAGAGAAACDSHDEAGHTHGDGDHLDFCELPKVCREIVDACHNKDEGTGKINECHETGHDVGTESACAAVHDDCIATCNAAPPIEGGTNEHFECEGGAGEHDAGKHD